MDSGVIRRKEARERSLVFYNDNLGDLGGNATLTAQFGVMQTELNTLDAAMAAQVGAAGDASQAFDVKRTNREDLRGNNMDPIVRTARRMDSINDGISDKFKMPYNRSDQSVLATARAWVIDLPAFQADFIAFGLPATFVADLDAAADAFEASINPASDAEDDRAEATAEITDWILQGMHARRILDGICRVKYQNNPGKLAAWLQAAHIEKAPKKKEPTP